MNPIALLILAAVALTACSQAPEPVETVSWYREHAAERNERVRLCGEDPGRLRADPNCVNAKRAAAIEGIGSLDALPPMGLSAQPDSKHRDADERSDIRP